MNVRVYYNLNKHCWSIQQDGIVIQHKTSCLLKDVTFKVYETGRLRVIKEQRKNVHAYAVGELIEEEPLFLSYKECKEITYNPYKHGFFYYKAEEREAKGIVPLLLCSSDKKLFEIS